MDFYFTGTKRNRGGPCRVGIHDYQDFLPCFGKQIA
jgi:hypothetical protein